MERFKKIVKTKKMPDAASMETCCYRTSAPVVAHLRSYVCNGGVVLAPILIDKRRTTMKVKFAYYIQNNGDGSASVLFFKNTANAEAYVGDTDERFTDDDIGEKTLEFDEDGNLLTPERKRNE